MAISGISTLATRQEVVDFLNPHWMEPSAVIYKPYTVKWWYFIKPFSSTVWACVIGVTILTAIVLTTTHVLNSAIMKNHNEQNNQNKHTAEESIVQLNSLEDGDPTENTIILVSGWLFVDYLYLCAGCLLYQGK